MVRIIYHWQVEKNNFEQFKSIWSITTNKIHESVPGALGSFMLRSYEEGTEILTIAKWDSIESWKQFWGNKDPEEMEGMRQLGQCVSTEVFEEIEDYTQPKPLK